jgi:hypothetical protein
MYSPEGQSLSRLYQILPPDRQIEFSQVDLADRGKFKGSLRIVSDVPISITAHQVTTNVRNEPIMARLPSMHAPVETGRLIFPRFLDGPTIATQFFILRKGDTPAKGMIEFFDWKGTALPVVLR